ncbi:tripartite motif-containing protein 16-like isoform X2 [Cheilinus undulatus]|uniref:tripartite motif-containing protein 16-like isoform X2 n=1 Tax=Cheilinus undulatus TaxID=241271 RepID=UPI001BD21076|nr:tripartite motif-containing protein 16-like isoform X2 [Cheilinus undulatus]
MAEAEQGLDAKLDPIQFICLVCLDLPKDPVSIQCGHSFCKGCIEAFWDQNEEKGNYSCPQCRKIFNPRPVPGRNNMLAEVVEMLKRTNTQQTSSSIPEPVAAAEACAGPTDIPCDFCCGTNPNKATMSCLMCMASFCPVHLESHSKVPVLKKHQLVSASVPLQEEMCSKHNKLMEVYCKTDRKCICYLCGLEEHKRHRTVSATAERAVQQKQLSVTQKEIQERQKQRERELMVLLETLKDFKKRTQTAVKSSDKIFDELVSSIKKKQTFTKQLILDQEKRAVAQAEGLQLQLEEEITKLRKRDTELEEISHFDDHIHFIQTFQSLLATCESPDLPNGPVARPKHSFKTVTGYMSKLKTEMEGLLENTWPSISAKVYLQPEPKTREEFMRYRCPMKLDEKLVSQNMSLSNENLRMTCKTGQMWDGYYFRTKRTTSTEQMWCREGLMKRCYWEVHLSGYTWCVAVSYKDNSGPSSFNSVFGNDSRSWSLECLTSDCIFRHNNRTKYVWSSQLSTVGVFLDYPEGILYFYNVSGSEMTLLHKVETTFTEPLYPCIGLRDDGSQQGTAYYAELIKIW